MSEADTARPLRNQVALVTGGSRGIGSAISLALAESGATVVVNYLKNETAARAVVEQIEAAGGQALALQGDVSQLADVERLVATTHERFKRIDILVTNAAVGHHKPIVETTNDEWEFVQKSNVTSAFYLTRAVFPLMAQQKYGRIITLSSVTAKTGHGFRARTAYAASKAALLALTYGLAREGAPYNIQVNCICPGWIDVGRYNTPELEQLKSRAMREIPLGRLGRPEDIAGVTVFLASPAADYMTGQSLNVNGGLLMQ